MEQPQNIKFVIKKMLYNINVAEMQSHGIILENIEGVINNLSQEILSIINNLIMGIKHYNMTLLDF